MTTLDQVAEEQRWMAAATPTPPTLQQVQALDRAFIDLAAAIRMQTEDLRRQLVASEQREAQVLRYREQIALWQELLWADALPRD